MNLRDAILMEEKGMVYLPIIHECLEKEYKKTISRYHKKKGVHLSGASHPCGRNLYYQFFRTPSGKKLPVRTMKIFDVGHDMHRRYHRYAKKAGILIKAEMEIKNKEYQIISRLDQLVLIYKKLRLIELKSMNQEQYNRLMGNPHRKHLYQTQTYLWTLNKMWEQGCKDKVFKDYGHLFPVTEASIVIENKNTQHTEELPIKYDEKLVENFLSTRIKEVLVFVAKKQLPPKSFKQDSKECLRCDYATQCWGG